MRYLAATAFLLLAITTASAQTPPGSAPTCRAQATEKKLAGAALKSFLTKCEKDATATCNKAAADKKLAGAAKTSNVKKCVTDNVGT
jgi:hypothetical protein